MPFLQLTLTAALSTFTVEGSASAPSGPRTALMRPLAGAQNEFCAAIVPLASDFILAGYTTGESHADDALLLRVDAAGEILWRRVVPGGGQSALWSVRALPDGGSIAAGWMKSARGDLDAQLVRIDGAGNVLWQRAYGSDESERLWALEALPDGFLAAGESVAAGRTSGLVLRTDLEGREIYLRTPGDEEVERLFAIQSTENGSYVTAGMSGHGPRESAGYDARIVSYDSSGKQSWQRTWGGADYDVAHDIQRLPNGDLAVVGYTTTGGASSTDAFLLRLSPAGELTWAHTYGGPADDRAVHLELLPGGGFAFVGYSRNERASSDMVVRATDAQGALTWERRFGGSGNELGRALAWTQASGLVVVGHSQSYGPLERIVLIRLEALDG